MPYKTRIEQKLPSVMQSSLPTAFKEYLKAYETPLYELEKQIDAFPNSLLPEQTTYFDFLFWALGAEDLNWQEHSPTKKRAILKRLFELYRIKGTIPGYALALELIADKSLIKVSTSPSKAFCGHSTTAAEKEEFESKYPEIRVYPFSHDGVGNSMFAGDFIADWAEGCPAKTDAGDRIGDRVTIYDPAVDEEDILNNYFNRRYIEVRLKGIQRGFFASAPLESFMVAGNAASRFYTIDMQRPYVNDLEKRSSISLGPSLTPMTVYYKTTSLTGYSGGLFPGGDFTACYPVDTDAEKRIFKSLRLFDPMRSISKASKGQEFLGDMHLGKLACNEVEICVDMTRTKPLGMYAGTFIERTVESDAAAEVEKALFALNYVREAGTQGVVTINSYKQIKANNAVLAGSRLAGEYVKEV